MDKYDVFNKSRITESAITPSTPSELFANEMSHRDYQLAMCEDFSFLDNFTVNIKEEI